jgi:hypothetical protein
MQLRCTQEFTASSPGPSSWRLWCGGSRHRSPRHTCRRPKGRGRGGEPGQISGSSGLLLEEPCGFLRVNRLLFGEALRLLESEPQCLNIFAASVVVIHLSCGHADPCRLPCLAQRAARASDSGSHGRRLGGADTSTHRHPRGEGAKGDGPDIQ